MIKYKLTPLLLLILPLVTFGQKQLIFHVFDANSKDDLAFANVFLEKNKIGDATDLKGLAKLEIHCQLINIDIVKCTYVGYEDKFIEVNLSEIDTVKISLKPKHIILEEVVVTENNESLTGKELVKAAIKNIKKNYVEKPSNLKAFYREKLVENDKCIEINEALCTFYYTKYPQKGYVKKSFRNYWSNEFRDDHPSRGKVNGILLALGTPQFYKYYNTISDKCYIQTSAISDNLSEHSLNTWITGGPLSLTAIDKVKYLADFLDPKLINQYQYFRKDATYIDNVLCIAVSFKPKILLKSVFQSWNKKVHFPLYSGTIFISTKDFAIVKFESQFSPIARIRNDQLTEPWQIFPKSVIISVDYKRNLANKWYLKSVRTEQVIDRNSSLKWKIPENYNCVRELVITDIIMDNPQNFDNSNKSLFKDMNSAVLRNFRSSYNQELWQAFKTKGHYPTLSVTELEDLEKENSLDYQFKAFE